MSKKKYSFSGPHKVNSRTEPSGFAFSKMTAPSKYAFRHIPYVSKFSDVVVYHLPWYKKIWVFVRSLFSF